MYTGVQLRKLSVVLWNQGGYTAWATLFRGLGYTRSCMMNGDHIEDRDVSLLHSWHSLKNSLFPGWPIEKVTPYGRTSLINGMLQNSTRIKDGDQNRW